MTLAWKRLISALALVVITVSVFIPAMNAGFIWDDDYYVTENPTLIVEDGLTYIWFSTDSTPQYYPLVHTTYWFEYSLWGYNAKGYHIVNILLHALSALLLWRALVSMSIPGAWLAALLFAIHPVQVETVAWITERKNVLSCVFYLASFLCLIHYFLVEEIPRKKKTLLYTAGFLFFVCALLSKSVTATLPVVMLIALWYRREKISWHHASALAPFFMMGLVMGLHTAWLEVHHVGASGPEWNLSLGQKLILQGKVPMFYAWKLAFPFNLVFNYPRWEVDPGFLLSYGYLAGLVGIITALWLNRDRVSRGPLAAVLFFLVTLFPASGIFNVYPFRFSYVADHFQYMACIGLLTLFAAWWSSMFRKFQWQGIALTSLLVILLGNLTWTQSHAYKDQETLWRHTLKGNPNSFQAHNDLGVILADRQEFSQAQEHYSKALEVNPNLPEALYNMSMMYQAQGDMDMARYYAQKAIEQAPQRAKTQMNMGVICKETGDDKGALKHFALAVAAEPDWGQANLALAEQLVSAGMLTQSLIFYDNALNDMERNVYTFASYAKTLQRLKAYGPATDLYLKAMELAPGSWELHIEYALMCLKYGNKFEAKSMLQKATDLTPKIPQAQKRLASAFKAMGDYKTEIRVLDQILAEHPEDREALAERAKALYHSGQPLEALNIMKRLVEETPENSIQQYNYGLMLLAMKRYEKARQHLELAAAIAPEYLPAQKALEVLEKRTTGLQ